MSGIPKVSVVVWSKRANMSNARKTAQPARLFAALINFAQTGAPLAVECAGDEIAPHR